VVFGIGPVLPRWNLGPQRFHEIGHIAPIIHFVIPGPRSEAQANPESSNQQRRLLDRPVEPGDDSEVWLHLNEKRSDRR
jgi:hypothetical protein